MMFIAIAKRIVGKARDFAWSLLAVILGKLLWGKGYPKLSGF
jgi:hypothetical protein